MPKTAREDAHRPFNKKVFDENMDSIDWTKKPNKEKEPNTVKQGQTGERPNLSVLCSLNKKDY